jgi:DUF2075 family protein
MSDLASLLVGEPYLRVFVFPRSSLWATADGGFGQVGCVYTAQGFEYDWNGVIMGPDLVWRNGRLITVRSASKDPELKKASQTKRPIGRSATPTRSC